MAKKYKHFSNKSRDRFERTGEEIDYKNYQVLQKLCTNQGKIFSRKRSGNSAKHQRAVKVAIKRARFMALLPYVGQS
jgi:small subunit ribosomal protein S18